MPAKWPVGIVFHEKVLSVEATTCHVCGWPLNYRTNRIHCVYTLRGPLRLTCKLSSCWNPHCSEYEVLRNPEAERLLTMPRWRIGWDVLLWMGYRRCKRHWSIPQIQAELADSYQFLLSEKMLTAYVQKYQVMVAAWHQDVARLKTLYQESTDLILTIDGIQPEKGHETLYVVRELRHQRVWFAESLLSSSNAEIRKLIRRAKQLVEALDKPVCGWMSDKQAAFVTAIAEEFPGVAHRYCANHFLRDVAQLVAELDSHAKVQMRKKIRGLRSLEQAALAECNEPRSTLSALTPAQRQVAAQIVLDYCAAVRGVLNDNHGGPLRPAGWRMAEALEAIKHSLARNLQQHFALGDGPFRVHAEEGTVLAALTAHLQRGVHATVVTAQPIRQLPAVVNDVVGGRIGGGC